jgi:hypothetical protein
LHDGLLVHQHTGLHDGSDSQGGGAHTGLDVQIAQSQLFTSRCVQQLVPAVRSVRRKGRRRRPESFPLAGGFKAIGAIERLLPMKKMCNR